jgi:hypothetical protein
LVPNYRLDLSNPERDATSWVLRPADPSGAFKDWPALPYKNCFTIQNWVSKRYLGPTKLYEFAGKDETFNWRFFLYDIQAALQSITPPTAASNEILKGSCWTIAEPPRRA